MSVIIFLRGGKFHSDASFRALVIVKIIVLILSNKYIINFYNHQSLHQQTPALPDETFDNSGEKVDEGIVATVFGQTGLTSFPAETATS